MTQHTHECWGDDSVPYPEDSPEVKDVNVWIHPSLLIITHDYSCPICREKHAVISNGVMTPCWECRKEGFRVIKLNSTNKCWLYNWFNGIKDKVY